MTREVLSPESSIGLSSCKEILTPVSVTCREAFALQRCSANKKKYGRVVKDLGSSTLLNESLKEREYKKRSFWKSMSTSNKRENGIEKTEALCR